MTRTHSILAIAACLSATFAMGSIHAFGVLLDLVEVEFDGNRAGASLVYSIGLVCVTLAVLAGSSLYCRFSGWVLFASAGVTALTGTVLAATGHWLALIIGYGVLFGFASGIGYGFGLYAGAQAAPNRKGLVLGAVTAFYAAGAIAFTLSFETLKSRGASLQHCLLAAAIAITLLMAVATVLMRSSHLATRHADEITQTGHRLDTGELIYSWLTYACGVFAGLMVIPHAAAIMIAAGATSQQASVTVASLAAGNAIGGLSAGWLADRLSINYLLATFCIASAVALLALGLHPGPEAAMWCLVLAGSAYGAFIAVYPTAVAIRFGPALSATAYGRIFTAWGASGLAAPVLAGVLYGATGTYTAALMTAATIALMAAALSLRLKIKSQ